MTFSLSALKALVDGMTPAPWTQTYHGKQQSIQGENGTTNVCFFPIPDTDADFEANRGDRAGIVAMRNSAPTLIARLEAAERVVEAAKVYDAALLAMRRTALPASVGVHPHAQPEAMKCAGALQDAVVKLHDALAAYTEASK